MLIPDPKPPLRSPPRTRRGGARRGARHFAGIERLAVERPAGPAWLDLGAGRHRAGIDGLAARRTTGGKIPLANRVVERPRGGLPAPIPRGHGRANQMAEHLL